MPTISYSIKKYLNEFLYKIDFEDSVSLYFLTTEDDWKLIYKNINDYYIEKYTKFSKIMLSQMSPSSIEDFVDVINDYSDFLKKFSFNDSFKIFGLMVESTVQQLFDNCMSLGYTRESAYELSRLILSGIDH